MKSYKNKNALQTRARNMVRGAVSMTKMRKTPLESTEMWKWERTALNQISEAISIAKASLTSTEFDRFEKWVNEQLVNSPLGSSRLGKGVANLGAFPVQTSSKGLADELKIALAQLQRKRLSVIKFYGEVRELSKFIKRMEWDSALTTLATMNSAQGLSYWAIETELAIIQEKEGIEALKKKVSDFLVLSIGITKFLVHNFGIRNEPAQNSSRFRTNLKRRIDESSLSIELSSYLKFRLYGITEYDSLTLARVLACEQLTTEIDLYFTTLRVSGFIVSNPALFSEEVLSIATQALQLRGEETEKIHSVTTGECNLTNLVGSAIDFTFGSQVLLQHDEHILIPGLSAKLSTRKDGEKTERLAKYLLNFNWLEVSKEIGQLADVPDLSQLLLQMYHQNEAKKQSLIVSHLQSELKRWLMENERESKIFDILRDTVFHRNELVKYSQIRIASNDVFEDHPIAVDLIEIVLAHIYFDQGFLEECMKVCSNTGLRRNVNLSALPLVEMFQGVRWKAFQSMTGSCDLSICLDLSLKLSDNGKIRTYKRYAVEELMKACGVDALPALPAALNALNIELQKIEYFVTNVCDLVTIELLPQMEDSRKALTARCELLKSLVCLHTENELEYTREIEEIEGTLLVSDSMELLDDSKVYVDEQAILNSINKELASDFQRYLKLSESGLGEANSLQDVIKGIRNHSSKIFQIPKNDAESLLAELINSVMEKFMFDPVSGLDTIIGRRIRHGTIASELRGVLEERELIGQRARAGATYDPPGTATSITKYLDAKQRKVVHSAFSRFSDSIDQLIALLRDEYFHVNSKQKPRGIFELSINPVMLALVRSISVKCSSVDQFSREVIQVFWYFLSIRAEAIKLTVEKEIKRELNSAFSKLIGEIRSYSDPLVIAEIQRASEELQRRASTISAWIRVPTVNVEGKTYSMQHAFDVALAVVMGQHSNFHPIISHDVKGCPDLDAHGFSIVGDALLIALKNVYEHSNKKVDNRVKVKISYNESESLISFEIENEVDPSVRSADKDSKIINTLNDIKKRAYRERARLDRGSGLSKLAAIVMQSEKTQIDFGYTAGGLFRLQFQLDYIGFHGGGPGSQQINLGEDQENSSDLHTNN